VIRSCIRLVVAVVAAATVSLPGLAVASAAATARPQIITASGEVGQPQPELAAFAVSPPGVYGGSGAVLPDGTLVLAWIVSTGRHAFVCTLHPGVRKCASTATLKASPTDFFFDSTVVFATGGRNVTIAVYDRAKNGTNSVLVFNSANDGKTFSGDIRAGDLPGLATGTQVGSQLVLSPSLNVNGLQIQAVVAHPKVPQTAIANPAPADLDTSLTGSRNGVLVAFDHFRPDHHYVTAVLNAPHGANFNATSSYHNVGSFADEQLAWASGTALLTQPGQGGARLRFFTGSGYGAGHKVPEPVNPADGQFSVARVAGVTHVFFVADRLFHDVITETTRDGVHWSGLHVLSSFAFDPQSAPVLGPSGAGLFIATTAGAGHPALAQPILNPQRVTLTLARSRVPKGQSTKATGTVTPMLAGQTVILQRLSRGRWFPVAVTREKAGGKFSFTIRGGVTSIYRAVVTYQPGFYLYGYSNTVKLMA
jgi:hypothetical protein